MRYGRTLWPRAWQRGGRPGVLTSELLLAVDLRVGVALFGLTELGWKPVVCKN